MAPERLRIEALPSLSKRWVALILALVAFCLALRMNAELGRRALRGDEPDYHRIAVRLVTTGRFGTAYRFPAYPMIMAGLYRLFGPNPAVMRIPNALLAALTVLLTYLLAREAGMSEHWAILPALLLMADAYLFHYAGMLLTENLFTPMVLVAALVLGTKANAENRAARTWAITGGAILGILVLTRGQGVFVWAACLAYGGWNYWRTRYRPGLPVWGYSAVATAVIGVIAWNAVIYRELGRCPGLTTGTGEVLYGSYCPEAYRNWQSPGDWVPPAARQAFKQLPVGQGEWTGDRRRIRAAVRSIFSHNIEQTARLVANRLFTAVYPSPFVSARASLWRKTPAVLLAWTVMVGFVLALCRYPRQVRRSHIPFYLGTLAVVVVFYGAKRLVFPVFPLICIDSVRGWRSFGMRVRAVRM